MKTKTIETEIKYLEKAEQIVKRFEKETLLNIHSSLDDFYAWFYDLLTGLSPSSIRLYKAVMVYYFEQIKAPIQIIGLIKNIHIEQTDELPKRTSALKNKKVIEPVLKKVVSRILNTKSEYSIFTALLLVTNLYFGFRPVEWKSAAYDDKSITIKNAKATNGRANGKYRVISFQKKNDYFTLAKALIAQIDSLLKRHTWETVYASSRSLLYYSQHDIPEEEKISFYSTRHQVAANLKQTGLSREEIAVIMGHKSINTASIHYAKKNVGRKIKKDEIPRCKPTNMLLNSNIVMRSE